MTKKQKIWTSIFLILAALLAFLSAYIFAQAHGDWFDIILYNSGGLLFIAYLTDFPTSEVERPLVIKRIPSSILIFASLNLLLIILSYVIGLWIPIAICMAAVIYFSGLISILWKKGINN